MAVTGIQHRNLQPPPGLARTRTDVPVGRAGQPLRNKTSRRTIILTPGALHKLPAPDRQPAALAILNMTEYQLTRKKKDPIGLQFSIPRFLVFWMSI